MADMDIWTFGAKAADKKPAKEDAQAEEKPKAKKEK